MLKRFFVGAVLSGAVLLLAGCGGSSGPETNPPPKEPAAGTLPEKKPETQQEVKEAPKAAGLQVVTLHVKDMTERMKLI